MLVIIGSVDQSCQIACYAKIQDSRAGMIRFHGCGLLPANTLDYAKKNGITRQLEKDAGSHEETGGCALN
jgi:hypothetical protein